MKLSAKDKDLKAKKLRLEKLRLEKQKAKKLKIENLRISIFNLIQLNCPWIFSPLQASTVTDLEERVDKCLETFLEG